MKPKERVYPKQPTYQLEDDNVLILVCVINTVASILFECWHDVEIGKYDARSPIGDLTLRLRDALYMGQDHAFSKDYEETKAKKGW